jgi:hypothetical protein
MQRQAEVRHCHSQCRRSAKPRILRSGSPRPPRSFDEHITGHATMHFPPATEYVPAQWNARLLLSISPMAQGETTQQMDTWTGIVERVVCTKVVLPALVRRPPFHVGIRAATALTKACSLARLSRESDRGALGIL